MPMICGQLLTTAGGTLGSWGQGRSWHIAAALTATAAVAFGSFHRFIRSRPATSLNPKRVIVLTGCDSGLGYSLAVHCLSRGANVVAGVLRDNGPAYPDLEKKGATVLRLDITDAESVENFGQELERILDEGKLELQALVNNAGVMTFGEFEWQLPEQARSQIEVNVLGTMSITRRLLPLVRAHSSRIVNVTSHCAFAPLPGLSVYGASKAALQAWSTSLRVELRKYGVQVVMFVPGSFARDSNILVQQKKHFDDMRSGMSEEARRFYGDYFERYASYLTGLSGENGLRRLENPQVYETFEGALLDERPSAVYKCEPWRYKLYHTLFRIAPTRARDWLVERFVQMPSWRRPDDRSSSKSSLPSCHRDGENNARRS